MAKKLVFLPSDESTESKSKEVNFLPCTLDFQYHKKNL